MSTQFNSLTRPGIFLVEDTAGYRVPEIAPFNRVYCFGFSESGDELEPTLVTSSTDFTNVFGTSNSLDAVKLYYANDPQGKFYFINVPISNGFEISLNSITAGALDFSITVGSNSPVAISVTLTGSETESQAITKIIDAINLAPVAVVATLGSESNKVRVYPEVSVGPNATISITESETDITVTTESNTKPRYNDFIYAIENTFSIEEDWEQGFLIAPEVFLDTEIATTQAHRTSVATALENFASDKRYDWAVLVDCALATYDSVQALQTEGLNYNSPQGHLAFYGPRVVTTDSVTYPVSAGVAGVATRRYREQGFQQPPAGVRYALKGVTGVSQKFSDAEQSAVNDNGINLVRYLRNRGTVIWGARTRSGESAYKFLHARIIMNVLNGSLRQSYDEDVFTTVDGFGVVFNRLAETARTICRNLWRGGALYGDNETSAFVVVCDASNNAPEDLEQGNVAIDVYVSVSPIAEKILIRTYKVAIGQLPDASALPLV